MERALESNRAKVAAPPRRGSAYVLVLVTAMILTVIGISSVAVSRVENRRAAMARNASEARLLAMTAIEHARVTIESTPLWTTLYVGKDLPLTTSYGGGTFEWRITDRGDGSYTIRGTGRKGGATRILSATYGASGGLAVLGKAAYAAGAVVTGSTTNFVGGAIACGDTHTNNGAINGNVEAVKFVNAGTVSGMITPGSVLPLPSSSVVGYYTSMATPILYTATLGSISTKLISANSNPYGLPNSNGVYSITVPASSTLTITKSRLVATLVVTLGPGATLRLQQANLWEKPAGNFPVLIVNALGAGTIDMNGFTQQLSEPGTLVNFNPLGTPYEGVWDLDILDLYPTEVRGLVHVLGANSVTSSGSNFYLKGVLVTEGKFNPGSNSTYARDASIASSPPNGYAGTPALRDWRWEVVP